MRPNATKSSIASFAASLITWPMPFMMAQISRKYSTNISIVSTFLSLKVSHFSRDSQGSCSLSAHQEVSRKYGQPLYRSAAISLRVFFSLDAETQILWNLELQQIRNTYCQSFAYSDIISFRVLQSQKLIFLSNQINRNSAIQKDRITELPRLINS